MVDDDDGGDGREAAVEEKNEVALLRQPKAVDYC